MTAMNILVTGASGLLGRAVMKKLGSHDGWEVRGTAFSRVRPPLEMLDLTDEQQVARFFAVHRPDVVIHLAAERRPDVVAKEKARAWAINVDAAGTVARESARHGAFMVLISTDYVFDGTNPPYVPSSPVHPLNEYGLMKLEAEREAERIFATLGRESGRRCLGAVLRIPLLYGPVEYLEECPVTELARVFQNREPVRVEHWAQRYPVHVDDVASAIVRLVEALFNGNRAYGLFPRFHLSGNEAYTKYEMVRTMGEALGLPCDHVKPDPQPPSGAPRPRDCRMDTSLLASLGWMQRIRFADAIGPILKPFFS
ncbi:MAG: SDR family oxidoreductase [Rectinema sp.]|nr:SDR family oxidoreductase [Rectinema sp.]